MINLAPPCLSCAYKCEEYKAKYDGVINTINALTADDGEKGRISPSLANTGNKTSDVIEPPDFPVKFDNPEDVFSQFMLLLMLQRMEQLLEQIKPSTRLLCIPTDSIYVGSDSTSDATEFTSDATDSTSVATDG
ncbi:hypothetical protein FXO37_36182 [Capsicum annuum]|nr:hypothetical protein FXO37_36182 [Capsicum annuum]